MLGQALHIQRHFGSCSMMPLTDVDDVADEVRVALAEGDEICATVRALDGYGAEVFGFVAGVLDDVGTARDVYATIGEQVRERLITFGGPCDLRTWLYAIACRALAEHRDRSACAGNVRSPVALPARGTTYPPRRKSRLDALALLRSSLPARDRELLVLRVDRQLSWDELATVFLGADASARDRVREVVRLRSRYRLVKDWLTREATARGILGRD